MLDASWTTAPFRTRFTLNEPFRHWAAHRLPKVGDLRDALNRIVHATEFEIGFEQLPENAADIKGGAIGVVYLRTGTDQREEALIDVFALASCFFHQVLPELHLANTPSTHEAAQLCWSPNFAVLDSKRTPRDLFHDGERASKFVSLCFIGL